MQLIYQTAKQATSNTKKNKGSNEALTRQNVVAIGMTAAATPFSSITDSFCYTPSSQSHIDPILINH